MNGEAQVDFAVEEHRIVSSRPLFVVGCHRSGTTLLRRIVNVQPGVHVARETGFLSELYTDDCHCETRSAVKTINSYLRAERWQVLLEQAEVLRRFGETGDLVEIYRHVCMLEAKPGGTELYWGDNTPHYVGLAPILYRHFPSSRFIHIVRDPRDVVASVIDLPFRANTPHLAALEWFARVADWLVAERVIPDSQRLTLRYEDLVTQSEAEVARVFDFLELPHVDPTAWRVGAGGDDEVADLPHHFRLNTPIDASRVGRYRERLSTAEIGCVEAVARQAMLSFGYQPDTGYRMSPQLGDDVGLLIVESLRDGIVRARRKLRRFLLHASSRGRWQRSREPAGEDMSP
ncbi:sulfotransferase [Planctomycetota bacterium]